MTKTIICVLVLALLAIPAQALEIEAPQVPDSGSAFMPNNTQSLSEGFRELVCKGADAIGPDLKQASRICVGVLAAAMMVGLLKTFGENAALVADMAGVTAVATLLLHRTNSLVNLGVETVYSISEYGKLLLPVMTAAMAAQGGVTGSAALYAGTALFNGILIGLIRRALIPGIWLYLALSTAGGATGEGSLKKMADLVKSLMVWGLKTLLMVLPPIWG